MKKYIGLDESGHVSSEPTEYVEVSEKTNMPTTKRDKGIEEIAKCIGRAVAPYASKTGTFYHNDQKYADKVPYTSIETEAENIYRKHHQELQKAREEERERIKKEIMQQTMLNDGTDTFVKLGEALWVCDSKEDRKTFLDLIKNPNN